MTPKWWWTRLHEWGTATLGKPWVATVCFCAMVVFLTVSLGLAVAQVSGVWSIIASGMSLLSAVLAAYSFVGACVSCTVTTAKDTCKQLVEDIADTWRRLGAASDIYGQLAALRGRGLFGPISWGGSTVAQAKSITFEVVVTGHDQGQGDGKGFFEYDLGYDIVFENPIEDKSVLQVLFLPCIVRNSALQSSLSPRRLRAPSLTTMTFDLEPLVWIDDDVDIAVAADRHNVIVGELQKIGMSNKLLVNTWKVGTANPEIQALNNTDNVDVQYAESSDDFPLAGYECTVPAGTMRLCLVVREWKQAGGQAILLAPPILCGELVLKVGTKGGRVNGKVTAGVGIQAGYDSIETRTEPGTLASNGCIGRFAANFLTGRWTVKEGQCFAPVDSVFCRLGLEKLPPATKPAAAASGGG